MDDPTGDPRSRGAIGVALVIVRPPMDGTNGLFQAARGGATAKGSYLAYPVSAHDHYM